MQPRTSLSVSRRALHLLLRRRGAFSLCVSLAVAFPGIPSRSCFLISQFCVTLRSNHHALSIVRFFATAVDAMKTTLQVEGAQGLAILGNKIRVGGPLVVYHGALATYSATLVGQYVA